MGNYGYTAGFLNTNSEKDFFTSNSNYSDIILSASLWSNLGNFSPGLEVNYANINNTEFQQSSAWITWYPLSNTKIYITPRVYVKNTPENEFGYNAFGISGGAQLGPFHFYGQYLNGNMENFIEAAGYVVSNFPGVSKQKISGSIYFPTGKRYQFVVRYINQEVTEKYQVYKNAVKSNDLEYNYKKHTITGGISWNF